MEEYDEPEIELIEPEDFLAPNPFPADARRMGFDRYSEEGAMIALAASLNPAKATHRIMAWVMLVVVMTPVLLSLWYEFA